MFITVLHSKSVCEKLAVYVHVNFEMLHENYGNRNDAITSTICQYSAWQYLFLDSFSVFYIAIAAVCACIFAVLLQILAFHGSGSYISYFVGSCGMCGCW